tara:strand:- start:477 stop:653 length:177 start_codon:yes stop_codon:yes gene_type:complete
VIREVNKLNNKNDKLKLIEFILDELNIKSFRGLLSTIFINKLSHKDLSNLTISILKNK